MTDGFESKLVQAVGNSPSLRTTVPEAVVKTLGLVKGQSVIWRVDKIDGAWVALVSGVPAEGKKKASKRA